MDNPTNIIIDDGILIKYLGNEQDVTIPEDVVAIGYQAFKNNNTIKNVRLSKNVTDICREAFYACTNLENIVLSQKTRKIDKWAFSNCENLHTISNTARSCYIYSHYMQMNLIHITPGEPLQEMSFYHAHSFLL